MLAVCIVSFCNHGFVWYLLVEFCCWHVLEKWGFYTVTTKCALCTGRVFDHSAASSILQPESRSRKCKTGMSEKLIAHQVHCGEQNYTIGEVWEICGTTESIWSISSFQFCLLRTRHIIMCSRNAQRDRDFRARRKIMDAERGREPCLLTWSAKEQIRYLHRLNPEEFSAERLSESFPISLNDVRRLLRNRYSPVASSSLIARHDRTVAARWAALQTGRDWRKWVSEDQRRRYSDGSLIKAHFYGNSAFPSSPPTPEFKPPEPVQGPFTALLKTYIRMQEDKRKADELEKQPAVHALSDANPGNSLEVLEKRGLSRISSQHEMEEYRPFQPRPPRPAPLLGGIEFVKIEENEERDPEDTEVRIRRRGSRRKYGSVQLDEIKEDIITNHAKQQPESEQAYRKWFEQHKTEPVNAAKRQERSKEVVQEFEEYGQMVRKYKSSGGRNMLEETDDKIIIPQDKKKVGAIYKYGDSFYDEDGEFMYRVPI